MSLAKKHLRSVALKKPVKTVRGSGYAEEYECREVSVQPLSGMLAAQMYGEKLTKMELVIAPPSVRLAEGMGMCVDVPPDKPPDYKVVYVESWPSHTIAHIELLPKAKKPEREREAKGQEEPEIAGDEEAGLALDEDGAGE